jgi:hypothetical protein
MVTAFGFITLSYTMTIAGDFEVFASHNLEVT